jgi:hypothetical protein
MKTKNALTALKPSPGIKAGTGCVERLVWRPIRACFSLIENYPPLGEVASAIAWRNICTIPRIGESVFIADIRRNLRVDDVVHYVPAPPDLEVEIDVEIYLRDEDVPPNNKLSGGGSADKQQKQEAESRRPLK